MARSSTPSGRRGSRAATIFTVLGLAVLVVAGGVTWTLRQLAPENASDRSRRTVELPDNVSVAGLANLLDQAGLVESRWSITMAARLDAKSARHLQPGVYQIAPNETPAEILRQVAAGRMLVKRLTFPEGFTLRQIAARLAANHLGDPDDFLRLARTQGRTFRCADGFTPPSDNLEGYLYPMTYEFAPYIDSRHILQLMVDQFDLNVARAHPDVRDWTRPIIIASLVEREARLDIDRPLIAGVLDNRLRVHMPLQVDATVEYALPAHKARLFYSDLKTPSPYNTYLHRGLPPGPICNPGLASIEAALNPAKMDYLYYVAAPDGSHKFSRTLAEQDRNIAAVRNAAARG